VARTGAPDGSLAFAISPGRSVFADRVVQKEALPATNPIASDTAITQSALTQRQSFALCMGFQTKPVSYFLVMETTCNHLTRDGTRRPTLPFKCHGPLFDHCWTFESCAFLRLHG
jgi:hypothetical protein